MDGDVREFLAQQLAAGTRCYSADCMEAGKISYLALSVIFFSSRYLISLKVIYERLQTPISDIVWHIATESSL